MSESVDAILKRVHLIWDELESMKDSGSLSESSQVLQLPVSEGAFLGIDLRHRFHLILVLSGSEESISRRLTTGISITTQEYQVEGALMTTVDVISGKRWRFAIEPFAAEAIHSMSNGTIDLTSLRRLVEEHRALWAVPKEPLSPTQQRGIIAELHTIERMGRLTGFARIISNWTGPERQLHDIGDDAFAVEVKSYHDEPPRVRINHVEQLDHRMDKRLTLIGVHIVSNEEGRSFPELIDRALEISEDAGCRPVMEEKLTQAGWREEDREEYESRYAVGRSVICPIRPETPVFPAHLKDRIPSSVSSISYLLHLNDIKQLPSNAEDSWASLMGEGPWPPLEENPTPDDLMTVACREAHSTDAAKLSVSPESLHLEKKSSAWHPHEDRGIPLAQAMKILQGVIVKSVNGLLNAEGGTLLIGVADDGEPLGLSPDLESRGLANQDEYELRIVRALTEGLGRPPVAECVRVSFPEIGSLPICRLDIKPSMYPVFTKEERFYVRNSNGTEPMKPSEMYTYCMDHWRT